MTVATEIPNLFTTDEAADYLGLDRSLIARYCRQGRLEGRKAGRDWVITKSALDAFKKIPREPGNPDFKRHNS